jgi:hypothetical protein
LIQVDRFLIFLSGFPGPGLQVRVLQGAAIFHYSHYSTVQFAVFAGLMDNRANWGDSGLNGIASARSNFIENAPICRVNLAFGAVRRFHETRIRSII